MFGKQSRKTRAFITIGACFATLALVGWNYIDPYNRHSVATGSIILITSAVILAVLLRLRTRAVTATSITAIVVLALTIGWQASAPSASRLEELAVPTVHALIAYRDQHGRYPGSLDDLGVAPPTTRFGEYRYEVIDSGKEFTISVGDYGLDLFAGFYVSSRGSWSWDT